MEYYVVVFRSDDSHYDISLVKAESHILATRKAEEEVTRWPGCSLRDVIWVDKKTIKKGEVVHLYSV